MMQFQFCHNCGTKVPSTARFCNKCGTPVLKLAAEPISQPPAAAAAEPVPVTPEPDPIVVFSEREPVAVTPEPEAAPLPETVSRVMTLDAQDAPAPAPEKPPMVFTLDSLPEEPEPAQPEPEPVQPKIPQIPEAPVTPPPAPVTPLVKTVPVQSRPRPVKGILARRGAGRTILAVLLCILIFAWSFLTLTVLNVRLSTSGPQGAKTFEAAFSSVDLTQVPASMISTDLQDPDATLTDWIIEKIDENYEGRLNVDSDDLQEFLEASSVVPFISEQLSGYVTDIYNGDTDFEITAEEIEDVLTDNADLIEDIFGQKLSRKDIAQIAQKAEDSGALEMLSTASLQENHSQIFRIAQLALSWWVIGILGVILLLLILLLQLANRSILRTCRDTGITLMVVSGIWGLGGMFAMLLPKVWSSMLEAIHPVDAAIGALLQGSLIPTAAAFGTGVMLVLIQVIGKIIVVKSVHGQTK